MIPIPVLAGGIGGIVEAVGRIVDSLTTTDEERLAAETELRRLGLEEARMETGLLEGQLRVNEAEARHGSLFVAGWRPAVGWVCVAALGWQCVGYPLALWGWSFAQARGWIPPGTAFPPALETDTLYVLLFGMLGLGGYRTFEKLRGVAGR